MTIGKWCEWPIILATIAVIGCIPANQGVPIIGPSVNLAACVAIDVANKVPFGIMISTSPPSPPHCGSDALPVIHAILDMFGKTGVSAPEDRPYFAQLARDYEEYQALGKRR